MDGERKQGRADGDAPARRGVAWDARHGKASARLRSVRCGVAGSYGCARAVEVRRREVWPVATSTATTGAARMRSVRSSAARYGRMIRQRRLGLGEDTKAQARPSRSGRVEVASSASRWVGCGKARPFRRGLAWQGPALQRLARIGKAGARTGGVWRAGAQTGSVRRVQVWQGRCGASSVVAHYVVASCRDRLRAVGLSRFGSTREGLACYGPARHGRLRCGRCA